MPQKSDAEDPVATEPDGALELRYRQPLDAVFSRVRYGGPNRRDHTSTRMDTACPDALSRLHAPAAQPEPSPPPP
ncbi:hypothetical protein GCM10022256_10250 [Frondihabitans peucedani]|uniref:Uncharacterized protein n=1 Tax=Frondihabitans peucedani TaxID=598626 RepID=A0ABP8DZQ3_9MICO